MSESEDSFSDNASEPDSDSEIVPSASDESSDAFSDEDDFEDAPKIKKVAKGGPSKKVSPKTKANVQPTESKAKTSISKRATTKTAQSAKTTKAAPPKTTTTTASSGGAVRRSPLNKEGSITASGPTTNLSNARSSGIKRSVADGNSGSIRESSFLTPPRRFGLSKTDKVEHLHHV